MGVQYHHLINSPHASIYTHSSLVSVNLINENYDHRCNAKTKASQSPKNEMIFYVTMFCKFNNNVSVATGSMRLA